MNESWYTFYKSCQRHEWKNPYILTRLSLWMSPVTLWITHVTHLNESCHTLKDSYHTFEWGKSHIWTSCHPEWDMPHLIRVMSNGGIRHNGSFQRPNIHLVCVRVGKHENWTSLLFSCILVNTHIAPNGHLWSHMRVFVYAAPSKSAYTYTRILITILFRRTVTRPGTNGSDVHAHTRKHTLTPCDRRRP